MRSKNEPCPVTGARCYVPDCTDDRCDFQDPDKGRIEGDAMIPIPKGWSPGNVIIGPIPAPEPAIETRVENTEKAVTDLYWQLRQLKEKWEGKKDE